jgi:hypothetical protein
MRIVNERRIRLEPGETVDAIGEGMSLAIEERGRQAIGELSVQAPAQIDSEGALTMVLRAWAEAKSEFTLRSSTGAVWQTMLLPGMHTFTFLIEPSADSWYCENDDGNPPHPVSKGQTTCSFCGGTVIRDRG